MYECKKQESCIRESYFCFTLDKHGLITGGRLSENQHDMTCHIFYDLALTSCLTVRRASVAAGFIEMEWNRIEYGSRKQKTSAQWNVLWQLKNVRILCLQLCVGLVWDVNLGSVKINYSYC